MPKYANVTRQNVTCTMEENMFREEADSLWDSSEPADELKIEFVEMTEEEFESLPEFLGW